MKLVVLDGFTMNPGDLEWRALAALGELSVYERTSGEQVVPRLRGAEIALTNKTVLGADALAALPDLRFIGVLATGYNVVDLAAAQVRGIPVSNVPAYSTRSVQQMTFALLLELTQKCGEHDREVKAGAWSQCEDFMFQRGPLIELDGLTFGILASAPLAEPWRRRRCRSECGFWSRRARGLRHCLRASNGRRPTRCSAAQTWCRCTVR